MLITDNIKLKKYTAENRLWQGIPGIEVTKNGRIFICFYSGELGESKGNYAMVIKSEDGKSFTEPIVVAEKDGGRCYDPGLWIDPLGRLWFFWSAAPDHAVYASICDDPDAEILNWGKEFIIGRDVMMNKPTVLSTGEWLFPVAVWKKGLFVAFDTKTEHDGAFVYKSIDNGKTFENIGGIAIRDRFFDEHMILELSDGRLAMFIRTKYGIGVSYSYDRGKNWTIGKDTGYGGPNSRFFIRRLKSGRILLVNHYNTDERSHLTAMLSEDEGKSWKHKLLLDERNNISYPDAVEAEDGHIYIVYDRERASFNVSSLDDAYKQAREILFAKITEEDIINGNLVGKNSRLKQIACKLGKYAREAENPYNEFERYTPEELAESLISESREKIISTLFNHYHINCINMYKVDCVKLDELISKLENGKADKKKLITNIISLIRSSSTIAYDGVPIVDKIKKYVDERLSDEINIREIAEKLCISYYYMCHLFKKVTGITITDYRNELKIARAKDMLVNTDEKLIDIAFKCGFGSSSYFTKVFTNAEKISPSKYRKLLKH